MDKKVIIIIVAVALLVGVGGLLMLDDSSPKPIKGNNADEPPATRTRPGSNKPAPPRNSSPDPVIDSKPAEEFKTPTETFRVICRGRVVSNSTNDISNARVEFTGNGLYGELTGSAYTDDYGQYTLLAWQRTPKGTLQSGSAQIVVTTEGGVHGISKAVEAIGDTELTFEDIELPASRVLEGRVVDASGIPVHNVMVRIRGTEPIETVNTDLRKPQLQRRHIQKTAITDPGGVFRVDGLPPSQYSIGVESGWAGRTATEENIDLQETPSHWAELVLQPFFGVRGTVVDGSGNPLPDISVRIIHPKNASGEEPNKAEFRRIERKPDDTISRGPRPLRAVAQNAATTDAYGRFHFDKLADGRYGVKISGVGENAELTNLEPSDTNHQITLNVLGRISAHVIDAESGRPIEAFDVRLLPAGTNTSTDLDPFRRVNPRNIFGYHAGGRFGILTSPDEKTRLQVTAAGYAVSVSEAENDAIIKLIPLCQITFKLTHGNKRLALEPLVLLFDNRVVVQASSDKFGEVRIPNVIPSNYSVRVFLVDGKELSGELSVPQTASATLTLNVKE
ncbi:carboxypeptidase regulatory-like domain-containing protein [Planctomycetota bacterium]|nr:carboxypeptidase regulatory-like domain-containing protein [Planctomycetota bacterium]